jgi:hypothetical protein
MSISGIITVPESSSDRAVYILLGAGKLNSGLSLHTSDYGMASNATLGVSCLSIYASSGNYAFFANQPIYVYVNGTQALLTNIMQAGVAEVAAMMLFRVVLQEAINKVVITTYGIDYGDPYVIELDVVVVPGAQSNSLTLGVHTGNNSGVSPIDSVVVYSDKDSATSALSSISTNGQGIFNGTTSLPMPSPPLSTIATYPSYIATNAATKLTYRDGYGRVIDPNATTPLVTKQTDGFIDTLELKINSPGFYDKLQGYWKGSGDSSVEWDQRGYIKSSTQGTFKLYPLTSKGYVSLTVVVLPPQPMEITYYGFAGGVIDVSSLPGFDGNTNITVSSPGMSVVNGKITIPSRSVKFEAKTYTFVLNVLPTPTIQKITAAIGFAYNLAELVGLNGNIPLDAYTANDATNTLSVSSGGMMTWAMQSASASPSSVFVYGIQVASIILKSIDFTPSEIFAIQGRNVNLFSFFKTTSPADRLIEVFNSPADGITVVGDTGVLCFNNAVTSLRCKVVLSGVTLTYDSGTGQTSIPITVVSDNASTYYITQDAQYQVTLSITDKIYLLASTGEKIPLTSTSTIQELRVSIAPSSTGGTVYSISPLQECLLVHGGSGSAKQIHLVPFQSLQDTNTPIMCVKDASNNVSVSMPPGPTYQICNSTTFPGYLATSGYMTQFNGGTASFTVATSALKLYMQAVNLISKSSPSYYTLNIVEGKKIVFGLVNERTISNASPTDALPSFITQTSDGLLVKRTPDADMSETFVARTSAADGTFQYTQFLFKVLTPITLKQTLFYTSSMKYRDVLPAGDFEYEASLNLSALIKPSTGTTVVMVPFSYGEFRTESGDGGIFKLILDNGKITIQEIYTACLITGTTIHTTTGEEIDVASEPYTSGGVSFTGLPTGTPTSIKIELSQAGVEVGQYYILDSSGNSKLYSFRNVPAPTHSDVYLFSTSDSLTWVPDVPVSIDGNHYNIGQSVVIQESEVVAELDYDGSSPFYECGVSFNIVDVKGVSEKHSFCREWEGAMPFPIESYTLTPPVHTPYTGSAAFKTSLFNVKMTGKSITATSISPVSSSKTETLYIVVKGESGRMTYALELTVLPYPFAETVNLQYYAGDIPSGPVYSGPGTVTVSSMQYVSSTGSNPVSATSLAVGQNIVSYEFESPTGTTEDFESTLNIKVIPKPGSVNLNRLIKVGEELKENLPLTQFGSGTDYTVTGISIDGTNVVSSLPSSGSHNGLSVSINSLQETTFTAAQDGATTPGSSSPLPGGHQVVITFDYFPSTSESSTLYKTSVSITLSVFVWDPTNVRQVLAQAPVDASGTARTKQNSTAISVPTSAASTLISFNRDGQTLTGTSDDVLDWSEYSMSGRVIYLFSTSTIVRNYFIYSNEEVVLFTVLILPETIPTGVVRFPTTLVDDVIKPESPYVIDLLALFFPEQETSLLNAGAMIDSNNAASGSTLSAYQAEYSVGTSTVSVEIGTTTIATLKFTCTLVKQPTLIVQNPEFIIPINKSYTVLSEMVSLDSDLSSTDTSVRNSSTGITVSFSTPGQHSVACTLTNQGITSAPVMISFLAYDPSTVQNIQQTSWSGTFNPVFTSSIPSTSIQSYTIDGANYGTMTSQYVSAVSGMELTVKLTSSRPSITIIVKLSDGNVGIFGGTYIIVAASSQKQYLIAGASSATEFSYDQLSDVPSTTIATIGFVPNPGSILTSRGYAVYGDGAIVGYINASRGSSISLYPEQPGIWDLTGLEISIESSSFPINPYVETLANIITQTTPIIAQIGASLNYNLNNFVVSGVGQVVFTGWKISTDGGATFSSTLPSWMVISAGILKTTTLRSSGNYMLTCTVQSSKYTDLTSPLSFELIISNPADTNELNVLLVSNLETTLALSSPVVSIDGVPVSLDAYIMKNVKLALGTVINSTQQILTVSTSATLSSPVVLTVITKDSKINFVTITQVPNEQNLDIVAFGYKGSLFKQTSGSTVMSYTASGSSVPSNQLTSVFQPNMQQTIGTASVIINTDGTFEISSAESLKLTISYTLNNSTAPTQTISIDVGLSTHPLKTIEQSPPPVITLGTNVACVLVADSELTDGSTLDLGYASFKLLGNSLEISNISSGFQPTLVQAENILSSKISVDSVLIDISRDVATQPVYKIPVSSTVQYLLPTEPTRITYNTMTTNGTNQVLNLYTETGEQFAELILSGSALTITSTSVISFSRPIGFIDKNGAKTYVIVQTTPQSTITEKIIAVGSVISSPSGLSFQTAGTLDGKNIATIGQTLANVVKITTTLNGENTLEILAASLTESFPFYTTLSDGSIFYYTLRFITRTIATSDLTQIPVRSFTGGIQGNISFLQSDISISGNLVKNPSSLRVLTMTSPFYGQFTIELLK